MPKKWWIKLFIFPKISTDASKLIKRVPGVDCGDLYITFKKAAMLQMPISN